MLTKSNHLIYLKWLHVPLCLTVVWYQLSDHFTGIQIKHTTLLQPESIPSSGHVTPYTHTHISFLFSVVCQPGCPKGGDLNNNSAPSLDQLSSQHPHLWSCEVIETRVAAVKKRENMWNVSIHSPSSLSDLGHREQQFLLGNMEHAASSFSSFETIGRCSSADG